MAKELTIMEELDLVEKIKKDYVEGDLTMSEILRNEDYSGLTCFSKEFLLNWAGEDVYMCVDRDGNIVERED